MIRIGVLGTGMVGKAIANKLIKLGYRVMMGSRTANNEKALAWVAENGEKASAGTFADTAAFGELIFNCTNKIRENYKETETNAVGITNIRRRLEISYENKFELENWIENKNYFVHLKIFSNPNVKSLNI